MAQTRPGELVEALHNVQRRISQIGDGHARLVAVSKLKPAEDIRALYDIGHRHFGENYVQELVEKASILPKDINWHFIGALQSNKCKQLAGIKSLYAVETVDSEKKANLLDKAREQLDYLRVYVQVNTSGEESKSGVDAHNALALVRHVEENCNNLRIVGLMTIGALATSRDKSQPNLDFEKLMEVRDGINKELNIQLELSMGMSDDFEEALRLGSDNIRVGSTIFGQRPPKESQIAKESTAEPRSS